MTRAEVLEAAKAITSGSRDKQYGKPENNFQNIANLWNDYINAKCGVTLTATDVAMMMILLKVARIATGTSTDDSFIDVAGYAACGAEAFKEAEQK